MQFSFLAIWSTLVLMSTNAHIIVKRRITDQTIEEFFDLPALFGGLIPASGLRVYPLQAYPDNGCKEQLTPAEQLPNEHTKDRKFVLIIARNNCTFEEKIRNAQNAKYDAVIVYNTGSDDLEQMSAKNASDIIIPAVFVGETTGRYIIDYYMDDYGQFVLIINDALPFNINKNLIIPFSVLVGLCLISMICYMIFKCIREQRRQNHHRLPKRILKRIPVVKFTEGLPYESCIICLEEYTKGERIRVLPCNHAYHCHCVDQWLTKNRRVCPICKRKVKAQKWIPNRRNASSVSSDSTTDTDDDVQPLMNSNSNPVNHGTFDQNPQRENVENQENSNNSQQANREQANSEDDENVLNPSISAQRSRSLRENPFNRDLNTNQPSNSTETRSFWNIFRFLRRSDSSTLTEPLFNETEESDSVPITVDVPASHAASNNILNSNLSGSFKNDSSLANKDPRSTKPQTGSDSEHQSGNSIIRINDADADVFVQTPSRGGIGVAALPNSNLNRDQRTPTTSQNLQNFFI